MVYDDKSNLHTLAMGLKQIETLYGPIPNVYFKGNLANVSILYFSSGVQVCCWSSRPPLTSPVFQDVYRFLQKERQNQDEHSSGDSGAKTAPPTGSSIQSVIILDRLVDPLTPMITQLTYEGLIDEIFGIKCGKCWCFDEFGPLGYGYPLGTPWAP